MDNLNKRVMSLEIKNSNSNLEKRWQESFIRKLLIIIFLYLGCILILFLYTKTNIFIVSIVPCGLFIIYNLLIRLIKKVWMKKNRSGGKK